MTLGGNGTEEAIKKLEADKQAQASVQGRAGITTEYEQSMPILFAWGAQYDDTPQWWTPERDIYLRNFWKREPLLSGAVYTVQSKIKTTSWKLTGAPKQVTRYENLLGAADFGKGWGEFISRWLEDILTQDNGGWIELMGEGDPQGQLVGPVTGVAHLDAAQVYRTGNLQYPVIYHSPITGQRHLMHTSRVANITSMPSPKENMYGVGYCAISRVLVAARILLYIEEFKQEKLGGRPHRGIIRSQGYNRKQIEEALKEAELKANAKGLLRYMPLVVLASYDPGVQTALEVVDLASLPDNYNERETIDIYWDVLAAAFGVDRNEFAPIRSGQLGSGQQSSIQAEKAKGKGVGEVFKEIERVINWSILPDTVTFAFDNPYDEDDLNEAELKNKKAVWIRALGAPDTIGQSPITAAEQRQLAADEGLIPEDWLEQDLTTDIARTDLVRKPEAAPVTPVSVPPAATKQVSAIRETIGLMREAIKGMRNAARV